jgi:hypothetical protein
MGMPGPRSPQQGQSPGWRQPPLRHRIAEPPLEIRHTTRSSSIADSTPPPGDEEEDATRETPPATGHAKLCQAVALGGDGGVEGGREEALAAAAWPPPVSPRVGRRGGGERFDLFLVEVSTRISGYMTAAAIETISLLPVMPS